MAVSTAWAALAQSPGAADVYIRNTATLTYSLDGQSLITVRSNTAGVMTIEGGTVQVRPTFASGEAAPGEMMYYPVMVANPMPAADSFALTAESASSPAWSMHIYGDDGTGGIANDGVHQPEETNAVSDTGLLPPGGLFKCFVAVWIPREAPEGAVDGAVLTAASQSSSNIKATAIFNTTARYAAMEGQVTDGATGAPLIARVDLYSSDAWLGSAVTDAPQGTYVFGPRLPAGSYTLEAYRPGYARQHKPVTILPGAAPCVNFCLEP